MHSAPGPWTAPTSASLQQQPAAEAAPVPTAVPADAIPPPQTVVAAGDVPVADANSEAFASASLYIGDLDDDVTEPGLYEVFSQPASVASIRICRDSSTQKSLGYGYVNYHTIPDAERAMDVLNFTSIKGKTCRIMWANRDKSSRIKSENNVFVKNLDRNIDNKALYDTFSLFGSIVSCKVATDSNGRSLGYGYVQYEKDQSLVDAIKRVNGMQIGNNTVYCGRHKRKEDRQSMREEKFTNLYVKGWNPEHKTAQDMQNLFAEYGEITSVVAKVDDKGRHFMFINYKDFNKAKEAVNALNGRRFNENGELFSSEKSEELDSLDAAAAEAGDFDENQVFFKLYAGRHQSRAERDEKLKAAYSAKTAPIEPQPTVLYTRQFPLSFTDEDLKLLFEPFGVVTSAKVAVDEAGQSKGYGFVTMPETQDAQKAITGLHDSPVPSTDGVVAQDKKLYVAYLEQKDTRSARLKAQIAGNIWRPNYQSQQFRGMQQPFQAMPSAPNFPNVIQGHRVPQPQQQPQQTFQARPTRVPPVQQQTARPGPANARVAPPRVVPTMVPVAGPVPIVSAPISTESVVASAVATHNGASFHDPAFNEQLTGLGFKEQKQAIGDRLYHVIMARQPALAGKITGMMLEMPNEDLIGLLQRPEELSVKIDEAIEVLKAAGGNAPTPSAAPTPQNA